MGRCNPIVGDVCLDIAQTFHGEFGVDSCPESNYRRKILRNFPIGFDKKSAVISRAPWLTWLARHAIFGNRDDSMKGWCWHGHMGSNPVRPKFASRASGHSSTFRHGLASTRRLRAEGGLTWAIQR